MALKYNFTTGKWEEPSAIDRLAPATNIQPTFGPPAPSLKVAPAQPQQKLSVAPPKPLPALKVTTGGNAGLGQSTFNPQTTANPQNSTYNPQKAAKVSQGPSQGPSALPEQDTGQRLDLNSINKLYVVTPEGQLREPQPMTPAQRLSLELEKIANLSTSELVVGKSKNNFGWDQKAVGWFLDSLIDPYSKAVRDKVLASDYSDLVARGEVDPYVLDSLENLQNTPLQDIGLGLEFANNAVSLAFGGTLLTKNALLSAGGRITKEVSKTLAKEGLKEGGMIGFTNGVSQALKSGSSDPLEITKIILANTAGGAVLGAAANTLVPLATNMVYKAAQTGIKSFREINESVVNTFIQRGYTRAEAEKLASQGGFFQLFKSPKVIALEEQWQRIQSAKLNATNKKAITGFEKAQKAIELQIRREEQAGFVKNPFVEEADPITTEARKYKSAEEFVNNQSPLYRGGTVLDTTQIGDRGVPLTTDNKVAESFARTKNQFDGSPVGQALGKKPGQNIVEKYYLSPEAKIATKKDIPVEIYNQYKATNPVVNPEVGEAMLGKWAKKNGFDGIDYRTLGKTSAKEAEIKVLNPSILKTKSQLTDIWNKANKGKNELPNLKLSPKDDNILIKLRNALKPIKGADSEIQDIYTKFANSKVALKELGQEEAKKLSQIPGKTGLLTKQSGKEAFDTILKYEKGVPTQYSDDIAKVFNDLHDEAVSRGFDVPYRENYIPQIYDNTPEEVIIAVSKYMKDQGVDSDVISNYLAGKELSDEVAGRLKLNPDFTKQRVLPNYETAMKYGLTPRYTHPAQLAGAYRESLEKSVANRQLVSDLVNSGQLLTKPSAGHSLVDWPFLGQPMYTKNNLAKALNGIFADQAGASAGKQLARSVVSGGAKVSKGMQEIALSAGFPGTDINFFAMGQLIKQSTARVGQVLTQPIRATTGIAKDISAFIRANFDSKTAQYFEQKAPIIQKMADNGIDLSNRTGNFRDMYQNMAASPGVTKALGRGWDRVFQKKTFASFMPQLYVNTFEEIYKKGLKQGLDDTIASKLAADAVKAFHGLSDDVARSQTTKDALSTIFFAPKFREGIINTLLNTGKSVTTKALDPAFAKNRQFLTGMVLTFAGYQALNMKLNGNYTWENEKGKEFSLKIPLPDGKNVMYVEFMPSFLSLPRNLVSGGIALTQLDMKTAGQKFSSLLSMPVQITSQIIGNQDYFGRPIYGETDSKSERLKKIGEYLLLKQSHPYMRLVADYINYDPTDPFQKPLYQSVAEAAEFPIKFNNLDRISRQEFYDAAAKAKERSAKELDRLRPFYDEMQKLKAEGKTDEANSKVRALSPEDQAIYTKLKASDTRSETSQDKQRMFGFFKEMQQLKAEGKIDEANAKVRALPPQDQKAYKLLKESDLGKEVILEVESKKAKTSLLPNIVKSAVASEANMSAERFQKIPDVSTASVSSLDTKTLNKNLANGEDGGWCGEFTKRIVTLPTPNGRTGNTWGEKMQFVNDYGLRANEWRQQGPRAGDVVYVNTGKNKDGDNWGHVAVVEKVLSDGKLLFKESNWREDGKIGNRIVDMNSASIYGAIRGKIKESFVGAKEEANPAPVKRDINPAEFAAAIRNLN